MKKFYIALIALALFAAPAFAAKSVANTNAEMVKRIEAYFNALSTIKAHFTQANSDGTVTDGIFYLKRPGRLRFEYSPPIKDYIVADGLLMHYWDDEMKNYSNAPVGSTLADFFLRKKIKLSGDVKVTDVQASQDNVVVVTLIQTENPDAGNLQLVFNTEPLQFLKWRVTGTDGGITEITLEDVERDVTLDPRLFVFKPPKGYDKGW
jgi:outer membrane lipoprotein-sorting protein